MSVLAANCPSCGAPVEFRSGSSIVLICPYCRSALARTDRGLADLGKCAEVVQSESPLKVGLRGSFQGINFELTGRAQLKHSLGGFWDEWYATFSNGWVGWLAEAQGRFYLTFYRPLNEGEFIPDWENLLPGSVIGSIKTNTPLMVQEVGKAETFAAEGEIPYKLIPGEEVRFADLAGKDGVFATIDYSFETPRLFLGKQVSLEEIGLSEAAPQKREARRVSAVSMGCPNCGGPLDFKAPDQSERVTCPNCKSLLDVNQGNLRYLKSLSPPPSTPEFCLPIGAEGIFGNEKYRILGRMMRSVTFDIKYFWYEYLLYNPKIGFRWLVHSDNHWSFVEPVNPADVTLPHDNPLGSILQNQNLASAVVTALPVTVKGQKCNYRGKDFVVFQDATATVEWVEGEFYWKVEQGEKVRAIDYIAPPQMLSQEI
ncbi:MAG TPA: DUF4178 domain-containing protein, partial [Pyrinomonadaceae bacterium]|nr:DUF4178 domain-containing protein [Pyrinomonadaceae bacterium]